MNESDKSILVGEFMVFHDTIHVEKLNVSVDHADAAEIACHMKVCPESRQGHIAKSNARTKISARKSIIFDCSGGSFWGLSGLFND